MKIKYLLCSLLIFGTFLCSAQVKFSMSSMVHDFGDVLISDGPLKCSFELKNTGTENVSIYAVLSSCGCTNVDWTKEDIQPGAKGTISATYDNEEPGAFDKTLTVYVTGVKRPTILHIKGSSSKVKRPMEETFPVHLQGGLALRSLEVKAGNMSQGEFKSGTIMLANISKEPITVSWTDIAPQLEITPSSVTVKPAQTVNIAYVVNADRNLWGQNCYNAVPVVNGVRSDTGLSILSITRENFSDVPKAQYGSYPGIALDPRSTELTFFKGDKRVSSVCFNYRNTGPRKAVFHRIQCNDPRVTLESATDSKICFNVDATGLKGDESYLYYAYLYTNCPEDPVVTLYISVRVL